MLIRVFEFKHLENFLCESQPMNNKVKLDCKYIIIIAISSICGGFVFIVLYLQHELM